MDTAALRGKPNGWMFEGASTGESRWTAGTGNGGSSTDMAEWREMYMLISEPSPSVTGEASGECRVTSRNGADGGATAIGGDPGIGFKSRETRERLPRGEGARPGEFKSSWGGKSIVKSFSCGARVGF